MTLDWSDITWGENMDAVLEDRVNSRLDPYLVGYGPAEFSTCLDLVRVFRVIWDVNGYYRELGVKPNATRLEIREAYQKLQGWESHRLTFIMTQLLNKETRERYDSTPIGAMFIDEYVETFIRAKAAREVSQMRVMGLMSEAEYLELDLDPLEFLRAKKDDKVSVGGATVNNPTERWTWSYYLWGSSCDDRERLREWQELLISAFGVRKESHQLAIGFAGRIKESCEVRTVGYRTVVFLNDREQPTEAIAEQAVSRVHQHLMRR